MIVPPAVGPQCGHAPDRLYRHDRAVESGRACHATSRPHGILPCMPDDFVIARNPEEGTTLPYLLRIPWGPEGVVLKAKEMWPRTGKVYC